MIHLAKRKGTHLERNTYILFKKAGFNTAMNVWLSGYEIDVYAIYNGLKIVIQCKQYEHSHLNVKDLIHQWAGKNEEINADKVLLIILGVDISNDDIQFAKSRDISIWDQDKFERLLERVHDEKENLRPEILRDLRLTADGIEVSQKSDAQVKSDLIKQYKKEWELDYSSLIMAYEGGEGDQEILVFGNSSILEVELFPKIVKEKILVEAGTEPDNINYDSTIHLPIIEAELKDMITFGRLVKDEIGDDEYSHHFEIFWPHTLMFVDIDIGKEEIEMAKRKGLRCVVCRDLKPGISKNQKGLIILTKSDLMEHKQNVLTKFGAGIVAEKKTLGAGLVAIILLVLFVFFLFSSGDKSNQNAQLSGNQKALPPTAQQLLENAIRNDNISFCGTLSQNDNEQCIIHFAGAIPTFNDSLCETISSNAKIGCYTALAKARNSSDICLKLMNDMDIKTCYWDFVNSRVCPPEIKCYDGSDGGMKNCLECKLEMANLSRKELIELEDCTSASSNDCYIKDRRIAISFGEPKGCFNDVGCHTLMALKHNISLKKCDSIGADYVYCYEGVAYATSNFSICAQLPTEGQHNGCEGLIATDGLHLKPINNLSICFEVSEKNRYPCAQQAAIRNGDNFIYENCELLYQLSFPRDVYQDYALITSCSYDKAIKTKNITLCSRADDRKTECEGILSHLSGV